MRHTCVAQLPSRHTLFPGRTPAGPCTPWPDARCRCGTCGPDNRSTCVWPSWYRPTCSPMLGTNRTFSFSVQSAREKGTRGLLKLKVRAALSANETHSGTPRGGTETSCKNNRWGFAQKRHAHAFASAARRLCGAGRGVPVVAQRGVEVGAAREAARHCCGASVDVVEPCSPIVGTNRSFQAQSARGKEEV